MKKKIANWGNFPEIESEVLEVSKLSYIKEKLLHSDKIIARGNGRCYGDASLQKDVISTLKLNHFLEFDRESGIIECESGVLLSDILEVSVPSGYFLPVTPGTKFITLGGALASDVHGKNHHIDGCFSDHIIDFHLMNDKGEILKCSKNENSDLFWATVGGMGLTGLVLQVKFQLKKIETSYIKNEARQCANLEEIYKQLDESESWTYTVAWIDCLQKGKKLGKSLMLRGEHAKLNELPQKYKKNPLKTISKKMIGIPFFFPNFVLNTFTIKIFNALFYIKQGKKHLKNIVHYEPFFYPLDAVLEWNKIYGKKGFIQYQFVIPKSNGKEGMRKILQTIAESGNGSFLVVLKLFGKNNPLAYNSFPFEGYTLALDFKINDALPSLVSQLDTLVKAYDGRIYRAKDAMSDPSLTNYLKNIDSSKFVSNQEERISKASK